MRRAALLLLLGLCGCASASAFRAGEKAEHLGDWDRALLDYSNARGPTPGYTT